MHRDNTTYFSMISITCVLIKSGLTFWPGNCIWNFQAGFGLTRELQGLRDRLSTQSFDTNLANIVVWPGEPFFKKSQTGIIFKNKEVIFPGKCSKSCSRGSKTEVFPVFPGSQDARIEGSPVFPGSQDPNLAGTLSLIHI